MFGNKGHVVSVYVKSEPLDYLVKNKPLIHDGKEAYVIMRQPTENTAEWKVFVTGCMRRNQFGSYVEVFEGESRAIKIDTLQREYVFNPLTENDKQKILNMKIFKAHYGKLLGDLLQAIKPYIFVMIGFGIGALICAGISAYFSYQANNMVQSYYLVK